MYGSPPPTKSPLIKRERRGEKDLLRWVTDVCNHERWDSPLNELGPFTKVKLLNHLSTICSGMEGGIWYFHGRQGRTSASGRAVRVAPRRGGESIVILKRRDRWLAGWLVRWEFSPPFPPPTWLFFWHLCNQADVCSFGGQPRPRPHSLQTR